MLSLMRAKFSSKAKHAASAASLSSDRTTMTDQNRWTDVQNDLSHSRARRPHHLCVVVRATVRVLCKLKVVAFFFLPFSVMYARMWF